MLDKEIEAYINETVAMAIKDLKKENEVKENTLPSYKKTERTLYKLPELRKDQRATTKKFVALVDYAINTLADDPYYELIELRYFERWTQERIAEYFDVSVSLIPKNCNRLINKLRGIIYSNDFINEIIGGF